MKTQPSQRSKQPVDLGEEISRHRQRVPLTWWALLFVSIIGLIFVWWMTNNGTMAESMTHGAIPAARYLEWGLAGMAVFIVLIIISLIGLITYPRFMFIVYRDGFSYQRKAFTSARWDEVTGVQVDFQQSWWLFFPVKHSTITIHLYNGQKVLLDEHLQKLDKVTRAFELKVYPLLLEQLHNGYVQGAIIPFGNILLSRVNGLKLKGKVVRWESIRSLDVNAGNLIVKVYVAGGKQEVMACPVKGIVNLPILLALAKESLKQSGD
jgi:hypothetical protein